MDTFQAPFGPLPAEAGTPEEIYRFVVDAAVHAPSVHNTQPWWFSHDEHQISVHADTERRLPVADPHGREMMISCGAALFTVRAALRHLGLVPEVRVLPDPDMRNLVARVTWSKQVPPVEYEQRLFTEIPRRHTHRGGFEPGPLPAAALTALGQEAAREKTRMRMMAGDDESAGLAAVVEAADYALRRDKARVQEQAHWAPAPGSSRRDGVPATAYPAKPERTEPYFRARDFAHGRGWGLPPRTDAPAVRSAGTAAILTTASDDPPSWVQAGQALQRVLLLATSSGMATALHTQPLEIPLLREFIRTQFCDGAYPQMVLRLGRTTGNTVSVRRPVEEVMF
jgi:nitroreductase